MLAKVAIFCAVLAAVQAHPIQTQLVNTGVSSRTRKDDTRGNYAFDYDIEDAKGATNSRSETGHAHGQVEGSYTLGDIDGRARKVEYLADQHGFRAVVKTNEPGTEKSAPADAHYVSPHDDGPVVIEHIAQVPIKRMEVDAPIAYANGGQEDLGNGHAHGEDLGNGHHGHEEDLGVGHGHGDDCGKDDHEEGYGYGDDYGYGNGDNYRYGHGNGY